MFPCKQARELLAASSMTTERHSLATHSEGPYETALLEVIRGAVRDDATMVSGDDNVKLLDTVNPSTRQLPSKNVAL
jgi:hypothetical protein